MSNEVSTASDIVSAPCTFSVAPGTTKRPNLRVTIYGPRGGFKDQHDFTPEQARKLARVLLHLTGEGPDAGA